ncbi:MAG: hypothetical protein ACRD7E_20320, partial [Bryobacteraceae bacterium]
MKWSAALLSITAAMFAVAPRVPVFIDAAKDANLTLHVISGDPKEKRYLIESIGGGLAVIDYNNDGWMDLYVVNGSTIENARMGKSGARSALYR